MNQPMGSAFALVLHTHLPMVLNHGRWPHGSDWLCEAAFECYLHLLETAHRLVADGMSPKWTINLSPILTAPPPPPQSHTQLTLRHRPQPLRPGATLARAPRVRVSAAVRLDPADRARQWPRPEGQTRHRGIARQARARVLRGGRAPRLGRRSRLSLPRLHAVQGETRRARHVGAWDRGALALRVVSGRVARRQRDGGRVLPRPEDHAPGLEPRARLSGGLRVPRVPQEALPRRAALLAHHGQLRRPRPQDRVRPCARRAESRPPGPPFRRARDVHAGRGPRRRAGRRLLALRRGALRPLVVRGPALARAGHP